jgi:hypothetical protein
LLSLGFGADNEDFATFSDNGLKGVIRSIGTFDRLAEVDDVNPIAGPIDELAHLRVPTASLMSEVDASFKQFLHRHDRRIRIADNLSHRGLGSRCGINGSRGRGSDRLSRYYFLFFVTHFW